MPQDTPAIRANDFVFLREEIRHEDNLVNQRLSWLVSSQSFLLTAFAIALNGPLQAKFQRYERLGVALISWIPVVGVLVCLVNSLTILSGILYMRRIRRLAGAFHPQHLPGVQGTILTRWLGLAGPALVPLVFLVLWLAFLLRR